MHNRLLITLDAPEGADSEAVRNIAFGRLLTDDSFVGEAGRFGSPLCDWFVIGGRWTGLLAETVMGGAFVHAVSARFTEVSREWLSKPVIEKHAAALDALWHSLGGAGPNPYSRSEDEDFGYPDDAMLVSEVLYNALLAEHQGTDRNGHTYADLDGEEVSREFIGRKWLVVVDYHN